MEYEDIDQYKTEIIRGDPKLERDKINPRIAKINTSILDVENIRKERVIGSLWEEDYNKIARGIIETGVPVKDGGYLRLNNYEVENGEIIFENASVPIEDLIFNLLEDGLVRDGAILRVGDRDYAIESL